MAETRGAKGGYQGHTSECLMVGVDQAETTGPSWSDREHRWKLVRDMGDVQVYVGPQGSGGLVGKLCLDGDKRRKTGQD